MRLLSSLFTLAVCAVLGASAHAATFTVTSTANTDGSTCGTTCTLRQAINAANANADADTITFDPAVFATKQTIYLSQLPTVTHSLTLIGSAAGVTLTNPNADVVFVSSGIINVVNLTFANNGKGLGIQNDGATLLISGCTFANNFDAVYFNGGTTTLRNTTFFGNTTAIYARTNYSFDSCTLTGNNVVIGQVGGTLTAKNSIIAGNSTNVATNGGMFSDGGHNITSGTAAAAGLQVDSSSNPVLADNGGPTPTVALVAGGAAVNTGSTTLTTDQRGRLRSTSPDIGAFEVINAPLVVSVSPQGASDKVGAKRTFTLVMSDDNGAGDIREMWLLINRQLDWMDGATLIYRPGTSSPTNGQLFLRKGDAFLPPITIGAGATSSAVLDNGVVRVAATDVTVSVSGNAITLTLPLTLRDGLVGQNGLFARVQDTVGAVDPAAQAGDSGFVREGTYTVTPQFSGATNNAPTLSNLSPGVTATTLNSSGLAPVPQNFGFFVQDADGIGDIDSVWFLANKTRGWAHSATFVYYPRTRRLLLRSDDGNSFLGGGKIGSPGIIENSQVKVDLSKVKLTISNDGKSLGLTLPLQAKTGLIGTNGIWLRVQDTHSTTSTDGDDLGFVRKGNWNIKTNTTRDSQPSSGNS
ncbi:hypothetical protein IAD21_03735 [Abditibacteriota bacterium]|nr:hypothetical protein IAD21_03735 [Abditibacteriota bacterium]